MKYLYGALALLVFQLIVGLTILYSGSISVAASEPHSAPVRWLLNTAKDRSIRNHAQEIEQPGQVLKPLEAQGFQTFRAMCVVCHGAPSVDPGPIGQGLRPRAPDLSKVARHRNPQELFWVIKNGIKMTGMPGWGATHSDQELWAIVAFVERLGSMSPEQYRSLDTKTPHSSHRHGDEGQ